MEHNIFGEYKKITPNPYSPMKAGRYGYLLTTDYTKDLTKRYPIDSIFGKSISPYFPRTIQEKIAGMDVLVIDHFTKGTLGKMESERVLQQLIISANTQNEWVGVDLDAFKDPIVNFDLSVEDTWERALNANFIKVDEDEAGKYLIPTEKFIKHCISRQDNL